MKRTLTEIYIEVEETVCVKSAKRKTADKAEEILKSVIEICPHCHQAIFERETTEIEGEKNYEIQKYL